MTPLPEQRNAPATGRKQGRSICAGVGRCSVADTDDHERSLQSQGQCCNTSRESRLPQRGTSCSISNGPLCPRRNAIFGSALAIRAATACFTPTVASRARERHDHLSTAPIATPTPKNTGRFQREWSSTTAAERGAASILSTLRQSRCGRIRCVASHQLRLPGAARFV